MLSPKENTRRVKSQAALIKQAKVEKDDFNSRIQDIWNNPRLVYKNELQKNLYQRLQSKDLDDDILRQSSSERLNYMYSKPPKRQKVKSEFNNILLMKEKMWPYH
jgi:hypothetical protein